MSPHQLSLNWSWSWTHLKFSHDPTVIQQIHDAPQLGPLIKIQTNQNKLYHIL